MTYFFTIVCILMALAVMGLVVGVSNDAVNFLNSAIGSKAAPRRVILAVASLGVMLGAVSASGMMEVARSGIFRPDAFTFIDVMVIFMSVMFTNVILLDLYNTFGLPTSTTISLVFALLGSAVSVAMIKVFEVNDVDITMLGNYINSGNALAIISGILVSVGIAFTVGSIVMFITRLLFSFRYKRVFRYFGGIWSGAAITAITYFILIKGIGGSSLKGSPVHVYIQEHTGLILLYSFLFWSVTLQLVTIIFRQANILKFVVLVGTFSLALAFAGNDLVNFIGVPLAGLSSFQAYQAAGGVDAIAPTDFYMGDLANPVSTSVWYLVASGLIMVLVLWFSKKTRTVTETEVSLARQDSGMERFGSTMLSRTIVRSAINANKKITKHVPEPVLRWVDRRFVVKRKSPKNGASFDLLRASVNLTLSSILIALGTSLKLPLSTTYVTFMVAMGSSLADRAWGRDSAVYRITGVLTVISGWFLTAFVAFFVAVIMAVLLFFGKIYGVVGVTILCVFLIIRSNALHSKKTQESKQKMVEVKDETVIEKCIGDVAKSLDDVIVIYSNTVVGLTKEDRKLLKTVKQQVEELEFEAHELKQNMYYTLRQLQKDAVDTGHFYVMVVDYLREIAHALSFITEPSYQHIENNHKGLTPMQASELLSINGEVSKMFSRIRQMIAGSCYGGVQDIIQHQQQVNDMIADARKAQVKRIKAEETGTRNSVLYLGFLNETKNLMLQSINLLKALRDFSANKV